jgi:hypothetical protein
MALASGRLEHRGEASSTSTRAVSHARRYVRFPVAAAIGLALALAAVSTAQASIGPVGYFQLEHVSCFGCPQDKPNFFHSPVAADVNANGTGGAAPGDLYVLDRGNGAAAGRLQQFSASDQFVRLWGQGVVKSGPGNANEAQAVRVDAASGSFKLGFGAATTADIPATATPAGVESALNGLSSIGPGSVSVSGGPGDVGGTAPYIISFDGGALAGVDQPLLSASTGSAPLSGGGATVSAYTTNQGASGFEICRPLAGDECKDASYAGGTPGGSLRNPRDVAVDQANGTLFVAEPTRINAFSATGQFLRAWGLDVVSSGPDDSVGADERQSVTVKATGGTFVLGFSPTFSPAPPTTTPIPYNASAATVEAALNSFSTIGASYSSVTVTGGPGDASGSSPYLVTFHGLLGGDDLAQMTATATGLQGTEKEAFVETVADGGGYEICEVDDACKEGASVRGTDGAVGFASSSSVGVAPAGASNAGNVLVADPEEDRIEEFTAAGDFVRMFGFDVDATNPSTGFEVCAAASGSLCKTGAQGAGVGQFSRARSVAEDSSGAIYVTESPYTPLDVGNTRVQKFTPAGGLNLTPSIFGTSEVQTLTVNAGAGDFRLTLGTEIRDTEGLRGTEGTGDFTDGSKIVTNVTTTKGEFAVGQPLRNPFCIFRCTIVAVGDGTLTISQPVHTSNGGTETDVLITSNRPYRTADLPFNASSSAVESALNALPSVNANGGSVTVSGGPGDVGGSSSYVIAFDGGQLAHTDQNQIVASDGATPLSGGAGAGANTATVVTTIPGGPGGTDWESSPLDVTIGPADHVFVSRFFPEGASSCKDGLPSLPETRIEELDSSGAVIQTSDPCGEAPGPDPDGLRAPSLAVNPSTGHAYLNNGGPIFRKEYGPRINVIGPPGAVPDLSLEPVSNISTTGGTISGAINPNGPGSTYPGITGTPSSHRTTYRIEYKKASESSWTKYSPDTPIGSGSTVLAFSVGVAGLAPKTPYELKVVATKPFTGEVEDTESFTTAAAAPEIEAFSSSHVTSTSADLHALINPQGTETTYHFEYGTTPAYGSSTPETNIGESLTGEEVEDRIEGLQDAVYHFRVVATNSLGTTTSADQTFTFHPPVCPNQTVRQQTGAGYLPDCRAYELVSPEDAGGTTLFTGGPQSPYSSNPPRLSFVGQFAVIPDAGRNPINTTGDLYVATRGADAWHSRYIGPSSEEAGCVGGRPIVDGTGPPTTIQNDVMADSGLSRIIDWNLGNPLLCFSGHIGDVRLTDLNTAAVGSNAPYVWNANGDFLDRWPTAVADVPGPEANFACPQDPSIHPNLPAAEGTIPAAYFCSTYVSASKDLNHFVFSTQSGLFGQGGLTAAPGSAYDNDTVHNTLQLISVAPGGGPIGQEPGGKAGSEELIQFPAVSADGSHILMGTATQPACKQSDFWHGTAAPDFRTCPVITQPTHLYMRVDNAVTYDVSADYQGIGHAVKYIGSSPDGTKVYFTSDDR